MKYEDFKKYLEVGDHIQVVTKDLPSVMGEIKAMDESLLYMTSFKDKYYIEKYGEPVYDEIMISPEEIKYMFKIMKPKPLNVKVVKVGDQAYPEI